MSWLWGCNGERFDAADRLVDWSYAGYAGGDLRPPTLPVSGNLVDDFGAVGDGKADDTQAFMDAVAAVGSRGVLYLPPGW
jgi:sugar phosphate isomerase/epimerase